MGCFPLFVELSGRDVLVAGGGRVAEHKARLLLSFGASLRVVSPAASPGLQGMAEAGEILLVGREYRTGDIGGAALVVAATGDRAANRKIHDDAAACRVPVNVADDPELCTFIFPALVHRGDFVVGVTTSGGFPGFSGSAARRIAELFPEATGEAVAILGECRRRVRREIPEPARRREILSALLEEALQFLQNGRPFDGGALRERLNTLYSRCKTT